MRIVFLLQILGVGPNFVGSLKILCTVFDAMFFNVTCQLFAVIDSYEFNLFLFLKKENSVALIAVSYISPFRHFSFKYILSMQL